MGLRGRRMMQGGRRKTHGERMKVKKGGGLQMGGGIFQRAEQGIGWLGRCKVDKGRLGAQILEGKEKMSDHI